MLEGSVRELGFEWERKCLGVEVMLSWLLACDIGLLSFAEDTVVNKHSESVCSGVWWVSALRVVICDESMDAPEQNRVWVWVMWIVSVGVEG